MNKAQPLVDPFIPHQKGPQKLKLPQSQYGRRWMVNVRHDKRSSNNSPDIVRQATQPLPTGRHRRSINDAATQVAVLHSIRPRSNIMHDQSTFTAPTAMRAKTQSRFTPLVHRLQLPLIILGAFIIGPIIQSLVIGEIIITIYGAYAIFRHVPSRTTFLLAVIVLLGITSLYAIGNTNSLAINFAVYCFLLFIVGTVSLGLELRTSKA